MPIIVLITVKNTREANKISKHLLLNRLIACANIVGSVNSVFKWNKKIEHSKEALLILKSEKKNFTKIVKHVKKLHSYEVPEVIALPIIDGNKDYLNWIKQNCK